MEPPWPAPPELDEVPLFATAPPDVESLPPSLARLPPELVKRPPEFELPQAMPKASGSTQSERQQMKAARSEPIIGLSIRRAPRTGKRRQSRRGMPESSAAFTRLELHARSVSSVV
jgi:hypothetical protein